MTFIKRNGSFTLFSHGNYIYSINDGKLKTIWKGETSLEEAIQRLDNM